MKVMRIGCYVLVLFVGTLWGAEQDNGGVGDVDTKVKEHLFNVANIGLLLTQDYSELRRLDAQSSIGICPALLGLLNDGMKKQAVLPRVLSTYAKRQEVLSLFKDVSHRDPNNELPYVLPEFLNLSNNFSPSYDPSLFEDSLVDFSRDLIPMLTLLKKRKPEPLVSLSGDIPCLNNLSEKILAVIDDFVGDELDKEYLTLWTQQLKTIEDKEFRNYVRHLLKNQRDGLIDVV